MTLWLYYKAVVLELCYLLLCVLLLCSFNLSHGHLCVIFSHLVPIVVHIAKGAHELGDILVSVHSRTTLCALINGLVTLLEGIAKYSVMR